MAYTNTRLRPTATQAPPVVGELEAIFRELPADALLERLQPNRTGMGRPGYNPEPLWRAFLAMFYLGLPSVCDLIRTLYDNPYIAEACGFDFPDAIPSQRTFSRFHCKLASLDCRTLVKNVMRGLSRRLYDAFPGFGKVVAIDSTDVKAWSHGGKKGKNGKPTDPDAGWCVKQNTEGNRKYVWGYKVHIASCAETELPIAVNVTAGNVHDSKQLLPLLQQARKSLVRFGPKYVLADAAYSSDRIRKAVRRHYHSEPVIDPNPAHKKAMKQAEWRAQENPELLSVYKKRSSIERLNGRLKSHRRLNSVRGRGRFKVRVHCFLSVMVLQAHALATGSRQSMRRVA